MKNNNISADKIEILKMFIESLIRLGISDKDHMAEVFWLANNYSDEFKIYNEMRSEIDNYFQESLPRLKK